MIQRIKTLFKSAIRCIVNIFNIDDQCRQSIYDEIISGSDPSINYYLLLALSALIASFGLVANSVAVVIGAMLVSPLMMPIFGISLSLIIGETRLLRSALLSEFGGIILVISAGYLVGITPFSPDMTMEIINRTSPNLVDLFVAALAGFAGCMAMIDKRISPILPGIAMATSLTPPLAACGLCLAFGAYQGGMGAFILFFANFLTILLVGSATFIASGFFTGKIHQHKVIFIKRFSLAAISMVILIFFLTNAMIKLLESKAITSRVKKEVYNELYDTLFYHLNSVTLDHSDKNGEINAMVVIDAPKEPSPLHIKNIEERLKKHLHKDVQVFVETRITRNVSSSKDKLIQFYRNANGIEEVERPGKDIQILNIAGQIIRERLERIPGMGIRDLELNKARDGRKYLYTTVHGSIRPFPGGVKILEDKIRKALNDPNIYLVVHYIESFDIGSDGINKHGLEESSLIDSHNTPFIKKLQKLTEAEINKQSGLSTQSVKASMVNDLYIVTAEINGTRVMTEQEAQAVQTKLERETKQKIKFMAFSKAEMMVGSPL